MINLLEDRRSDLIAKGKRGEREKGDGKTRYEKRVKSRFSTSTREYNSIDMNSLFKEGILTIKIPVHGETDDYEVTIKFGGLLDKIRNRLNDNPVNLKDIIRALLDGFDSDDVYIHCSCLHPSTRIKLLDGTSPTVEEMLDRFNAGEKLYVYSTDSQGDFKPGEVEKVWITKTTSSFIKVVLDNGEEILTTPDHPYMLRNGGYIAAEKLSPGMSLMPLYFSTTSKGYDTVKLNSSGKYHSIYKLVAENLFKEQIEAAKERDAKCAENYPHKMKYPVAIHHKDFNKHNNHPENLQVMTGYEHWKYHASLSFSNRPLEVQENIRKSSRENAILRNSNPTPAMKASRAAFVEAGRKRNYDEDRKLQQSEIMRATMKDYYSHLTPEEEEELHFKRSRGVKEAWARGDFNTEKFHSAARMRGNSLHDPEIEKLALEGIQNYWNNISPEEKFTRGIIGKRNLEKAISKVRGSHISESHREKIREAKLSRSDEEVALTARKCNETKVRKVLEDLILNHEDLTEENYDRYRKNGYPRITKVFDSVDDAVKYFKLNHKVVSVEYVELPETPVYDIKIKEWSNFLVDAGVVLHNCPDWRFRLSYWATMGDINSGELENRPSDITNPDNKLGPGCKHVMLVLANSAWLIKVASVVHNYIKYFEKNRQKQYADIIYPAIYGRKYEEPVQLSVDDRDDLESDKSLIDTSNALGATSGRFKKGNPYRYQPKRNEVERGQISIEDEINK